MLSALNFGVRPPVASSSSRIHGRRMASANIASSMEEKNRLAAEYDRSELLQRGENESSNHGSTYDSNKNETIGKIADIWDVPYERMFLLVSLMMTCYLFIASNQSEAKANLASQEAHKAEQALHAMSSKNELLEDRASKLEYRETQLEGREEIIKRQVSAIWRLQRSTRAFYEEASAKRQLLQELLERVLQNRTISGRNADALVALAKDVGLTPADLESLGRIQRGLEAKERLDGTIFDTRKNERYEGLKLKHKIERGLSSMNQSLVYRRKIMLEEAQISSVRRSVSRAKKDTSHFRNTVKRGIIGMHIQGRYFKERSLREIFGTRCESEEECKMMYYVLNNVVETQGTGPSQYRLYGNGNFAPPPRMNSTGFRVPTFISQQGLDISHSWGRQGESVAMEPMPPESSIPEEAAHEGLANNLIQEVLNTDSLDDLVSQLSDMRL